MTVKRSRDAAKFSFTRTFVFPFGASVFSLEADVNHKGFWSQFTHGNVVSPFNSCHRARSKMTLVQNAFNLRRSFSFPHFMRRFTVRNVMR
eukprot:754065-Alexandrium_andersonii.AAC.1